MHETYLLCIKRTKIIRCFKLIETTIFANCEYKLHKLLINISFHSTFSLSPQVSIIIMPNIEIYFTRNSSIIIVVKPFLANFVLEFLFQYCS